MSIKSETKNMTEEIAGLENTLKKYKHSSLGIRRLNKALKLRKRKLINLHN